MKATVNVSRRFAQEDGISLVELLVVMVAMIAVTLGTLSAFDTFGSSAASTTRLADAQNAARLQLDEMTRTARGASVVAGATSAIVRPAAAGTAATSGNDLVLTTIDWPGNAGTSTTAMSVRYCVGARGSTTALWREISAAGSIPGTACPSAPSAVAVIDKHVANSESTPLFTVDGSRRSVGMDLRMATGDARSDRVGSLRSSAFLRSYAGRAPDVDPGAVTATCNPSGADLLSLGVGGEGLDVVWTVVRGSSTLQLGTGTSVNLDASSSQTVTATITNALGLKQVLTKTVSCP